MLKFTPEQQAHILANRREFNRRQSMMGTTTLGGVATGPLTNNRACSGSLIGNAYTLPKDVWGEWDREGITVQRTNMTVFNTLAAAVSKPMPIGKLLHYFQQISDSGTVNISMDGRSKAKTDQQVISYVGTPLPIVDSTFSYGWRQVESARSEGMQLDSAGRDNSFDKVATKLESLALDGDSTIVVGGATLYGLRTHPKRETRSTGVTLNAATGLQWTTEVNATLKLLHNNNYRVPATIFVNWSDWFYAGNTDYATTYGDKTIAQRVRELEGVAEVVPSTSVTANQIIAVVKNSRVVQVLNAMPMSTRAQFRANPEDDYNFITMAAAAIEVKYDATDQCGVAVSS